MLDLFIDLCFFLATLFFVLWLYSRSKTAALLPPFISKTINQLARRKLTVVLISAWIVGTGMLLLLLTIGLTVNLLHSLALNLIVPFALIIALSPALLTLLFFIAQSRLLADWFPALACPYCGEFTPLVNLWQCVGGCNLATCLVLAQRAALKTKVYAVLIGCVVKLSFLMSRIMNSQ